jgi:hypothetical protein
MSYSVRLALRLFAGFLLIASSTGAFAGGSGDRTQFGHNINIGPGEEAAEVTCFGCSVRVRGHVTSDVTTFGGSIVVEDQGEIGGDATTFGGAVRLENEAKVAGDVTVFGGQLHRDAGATVRGDVTNFNGGGWLVLIFVLPLMMLGAVIAFIIWLVRRLTRPALPVAA